jgi:hypothetical protein
MQNILLKLYAISVLTMYCSSSLAVELPTKDSLKNSLDNKITSKITGASSAVSNKIETFVTNNFKNMKYLDFEINTQDYLKPTFSVMSVTEIFKIYSDTGTIFNQTSLNTHDDDETINIGFGIRKLLNDNKVLIGSNVFYDHQFNDGHKRAGAGAEAISSIFDLRGNLYNAITQAIATKDGSETAMDGWDAQVDYHLPIKYDVNIFLNAFKFESPTAGSTFEETGNKFGANAKLGNFLIEGGYQNDNQINDKYFGSVKYVVNFGEDNQSSTPSATSLTDVSGKLYQPVKRENKIRVVKISSSGVVAGGF